MFNLMSDNDKVLKIIWIGVALLVCAACAPTDKVIQPEAHPIHVVFESWAPHWSSTYQLCNQDGLSLIQGLEGYSLIAGKDTLVAFNPPLVINTDKDSSWLDVYQIKIHDIEDPTASHIRSTTIGSEQGDSSWSDQCAELNFIVDGKIVASPGDYLFVLTWLDHNGNQHEKRIVARFHEPAVLKVLAVPVNMWELSESERNHIVLNAMKHYFARMPVSSDAVDEMGPDARYWDLYPEIISIDEDKLQAAECAPHDLCRLSVPIYDALQDYNNNALVNADLAIGVFIPKLCVGGGCASGSKAAICSSHSYGTCTHEIGHLLRVTEEPVDNYASKKTCGYFSDDQDGAANCWDWGLDTETHTMVKAWNTMTSGTSDGFFTRHFYESVCMNYGGGCFEAGNLRLKSLDNNLYLTGNMHTGEVGLTSSVVDGHMLWSASRPTSDGYHTYVELHLNEPEICNNCPFALLAGNPQLGMVAMLDPAYISYHSDEFKDWCIDWRIEQLAAGIITLECKNGWFLTWEETNFQPNLEQPSSKNAEHWTPGFQWRVLQKYAHFGYPP
jgi:hypothetical protein